MDELKYEAMLIGAVVANFRLVQSKSQPVLCKKISKSQAWLSSMEHGRIKLEEVKNVLPALTAGLDVAMKDFEERMRSVDAYARQIARLGVIDPGHSSLSKDQKKRVLIWWSEIDLIGGEAAVTHTLRLASSICPIKSRS
jgi:transcriptional regulator with XRE-family HTH domain